MSILKRITLILSVACIALPVHAMEPDDDNPGFFGRIVSAAKEYPLITASIGLVASAGIIAYKKYSQYKLNQDLLASARIGDVERVKLLLANGANIEAKDEDGWTPLYNAALYKAQRYILVPNLECKNIEVIKLLLEKGADIGVHQTNGDPLLSHVMSQKSIEIVRLFLEMGADIPNKDNYINSKLIHAAVQKRSIEIINFLLENGVDIEVRNERGETPLHTAVGASCGYIEIVKFLLEKGADIEAKDKNGKTPIFKSTGVWAHVKTTKFLLEQGADIAAKDKNDTTPLHQAVHYDSNFDVVRLLLEQGADIGAKDVKGKTPLYIATRFWCSVGIARLLLHQSHCSFNNACPDQSYDRTIAALIVLRRFGVPSEVTSKILAYLSEDIHNASRLGFVMSNSYIEQLVTLCPFVWFKQLYDQLPEEKQARFLAKVVPVIVQFRLCKIQELLNDPTLRIGIRIGHKIDALLSYTVEQHRAAIEHNVYKAFVGHSTICK